MSDSDSDEDLKRAIALSLQQTSNRPEPSGIKAEIIDLLSDEDDGDDDLDAPLSTNKFAKQTSTSGLSAVSVSTTSTHTVPTQEAKTSGLLGLDRKKMEEERLARANRKKPVQDVSIAAASTKRKASISSPTAEVDRKVKPKLSRIPLHSASRHQPIDGVSSNDIEALPFHGSMIVPARIPQQNETKGSTPETLSFNQQDALGASGIQYPDGVVKKTWVYGCPRQSDDIKIEEVLQKNDLELAVLSAFQVEPDWVIAKLDVTTKVIWVLQAKNEAEKQNWRSGAPARFRFCFPSMEGNINCMHSKLQLLAHPTHLRVVVPSANLVPFDWGETGEMESVCFMIDLPRLARGQVTDSDGVGFLRELLYFVRAMGLDQSTIDSIKRFDFSRTAHLAFVHSIGGSHTGTAWRRSGYPGLGTAVRQLGLTSQSTPDIDFVAASIGSLNDNFIKAMILAAQGDDGLTEYGWRYRVASGKGSPETQRKLSDDLKVRCRIYFPTHETVTKSKARTAGTIYLQSKWYDSDKFPRALMRDIQSKRPGVLMHSKMIFVRPRETSSGSRAWAYIGSANLSESAWGRLVKDKTTKEPKLNCRNWECGVVFPVPQSIRKDLVSGEAEGHAPIGMDVFHGYVPVPMVVPGAEYGARRPWFFNEE